MSAEDDDFVRLFIAANFADDIFLFAWAADLVGHGETKADLGGIRDGSSFEAQAVLPGEDSLWNCFEPAIRRIGVAIQKFALAFAGPENGSGTGFYGALDDRRRNVVLTEKIRPGVTDFGVDQQNCAFDRGAGADKIGFGTIADENERGFYAFGRSCGGEAQRNQRNGKRDGAENFETRGAFAPGVWKRVCFRVDVDARGSKRRNAPLDCLRHFR